MKTHRIIPCLDVRNGKLTKGIQFQDNIDIGSPILSAITYEKDGADELIFYDITASVEQRGIFLDVAESVAKAISIPYCVGGGIATLADIQAVMDVGAKKVSINSAAVKNPELITQGAKAFGSQAIIVAMDVKAVPFSEKTPSGYDIALCGGKTLMNIDAIAWAKRCEELGAGELCINSINADGMKTGYDIALTQRIAESVNIPVIASGGAGKPEHLYEALTTGKANAALVASIVHYGDYTITELKEYLHERGVCVRL